MIPLSTAIPLRAMKPTAAEFVKGIARSHSANTPPVTASGTQTKIRTACRSELNAFGPVALSQKHSGSTLHCIEDQRCRGESFGSSAQDVGRTDVARPNGTDVALAAQPRQDQPERDRAKQITNEEGDDQARRHWPRW